jgi:hypothetical protein
MNEATKPTAVRSRRATSEFFKWRKRHSITPEAAAVLFDVDASVIDQWDASGPPTMVYRLIGLMNRDLSGFHPAWKGWKLGFDGKLYGPSKIRLAEHQLRMFPVILRKLEELESSINAQARQLVFEQKRILTEMQANEYIELVNNNRRELLS